MESATAKGSREADLRARVDSLRLPKGAEVRRSASSRFAWMIAGILACTTIFLGYLQITRPAGTISDEDGEPVAANASDSQAAKGERSASNSSGDSKSATASAEPAPAAGRIVLESKGYLIAAHQVLLSPQVNGRLIKVDFEEGSKVKAGQVLAQIDPAEYQRDRDRAKATMELAKARWDESEAGFRSEEKEQAKAELTEAEEQIKEFRSEYDRVKSLRARGVSSQRDLDQVESQFRALEQRVLRLRLALKLMNEGNRIERKVMARAEFDQAKADYEKAELRLSYCKVTAPISGTVLKKSAELGNLVNPVAFSGSTALCELADLSDLEVDLSIQERDIANIKVGQKVEVRAEAYPKRVYEGVVDRLRPIADRAKGAIPVRVRVKVPPDEEGIYLKPDMGAIVSFLRDSETDKVVPK